MDSVGVETNLGLSREQESCLKLQLLKHAVHSELHAFKLNPSSINNTLLLAFLRKRLLEFPLFNTHDKAREKLDDFLKNLPRLMEVTQKATKHDQQNKKLRVFIVGLFNFNMRTPLERQHDTRMLDANYNPEEDATIISNDPLENRRKIQQLKIGKEVSRIALSIFAELEEDGGVPKFMATLKNTPRLCDLPPLYQAFFKNMGKMVSIGMEREYSDDKRVKVLQKLYKITPIKAIKAVLAIADPAKLLQGFVNLFLVKPFGGQSLLQKMASNGTEIKRTKDQMAQVRQQALSTLRRLGGTKIYQILTQIHKYVVATALPEPEEEDYIKKPDGTMDVCYERLLPHAVVINILSGSPDLTDRDLAGLTEADIVAIRNLLVLEMRLKDKQEFVDMLGSTEVTEIIKELLPIFYPPISIIFGHSFGDHFERLFNTTKRIVKVAQETKNAEYNERVAAYETVLEQFQIDIYSYIHSIAKQDNGGHLSQTLEWYVTLLHFLHYRETLDVQRLLVEVDEEDKHTILEEIDMILEYNQIDEGSKVVSFVKPKSTRSAKLLPSFMEMMKQRLRFAPTVEGPSQ